MNHGRSVLRTHEDGNVLFVIANRTAGIDEQTTEDFEKKLKKNLYKIWNRMSSGSYFPPPVRAVKIPKANGGERKLGIPTVSDRIAQQMVKSRLEPEVDRLFDADSYGTDGSRKPRFHIRSSATNASRAAAIGERPGQERTAWRRSEAGHEQLSWDLRTPRVGFCEQPCTQ